MSTLDTAAFRKWAERVALFDNFICGSSSDPETADRVMSSDYWQKEFEAGHVPYWAVCSNMEWAMPESVQNLCAAAENISENKELERLLSSIEAYVVQEQAQIRPDTTPNSGHFSLDSSIQSAQYGTRPGTD